MTKKELRKNAQFQAKCEAMNLNPDDFKLYDEIILTKTLYSNLYVYLDNNYNVLYISPNLYGNTNNPEESAYLVKYAFMKYYPLANFSLWDIMQLGEKVGEIKQNIYFPSTSYELPEPHTEYYLEMLSLIKFIQDEVTNYYERSLPLITNGLTIPEVLPYINNMLNNLVQVILNSGYPIYKKDITSSLGLKNTDPNSKYFDYIIFNVIRRYGLLPHYEIAFDENLTNSEMSTLDHNLKAILNISSEEYKTSNGINDINDLVKRLNDNPVLKR